MSRAFLLLTALAFIAYGQSQRPVRDSNDQVRIPDRPLNSLFKGQQGKQRTEIHFDPATGVVTLKLLVQDLNGYFIPDLRRDNFVVYENEVRQNNASVDIEHAPVSLALLIELGGRYPSLNKILASKAFDAGRQIVEATGREDKIAIWKYADRPELLRDFSTHEKLIDTFFFRPPPLIVFSHLQNWVHRMHSWWA